MAGARAKLNIGARMTNKGGERRDGRTGKRGLAWWQREIKERPVLRAASNRRDIKNKKWAAWRPVHLKRDSRGLKRGLKRRHLSPFPPHAALFRPVYVRFDARDERHRFVRSSMGKNEREKKIFATDAYSCGVTLLSPATND